MLKQLTLGAAALAAVALMTPASAAPALTQDALKTAGNGSGLVQVHHRHHRHHRHYRSYNYVNQCRQVCVGQLHFSHRRGAWHCHGYWTTRCY